MAMACTEILPLLHAHKKGARTSISATSNGSGVLAHHLRTCVRCRHGLVRLPATMFDRTLSCDHCLTLLPTFYEATHPDTPLASLSDHQLFAVVTHLASCDACHAIYEDLVAVAALEESM